MEYIDYEAVHEELFIMLEQHMIKELRMTLAEMNEYDISEFLGELWEQDQTRMGMVYRLLPKEIAADVFATWKWKSRRRSSTPSRTQSLPPSWKSSTWTTPSI